MLGGKHVNNESNILGRDLVALRDAVAREVLALAVERQSPPPQSCAAANRASWPPSEAWEDPWAGILFVSRSVRSISSREAAIELAHVYDREGARLLREACILRCLTSVTGLAFLDAALRPRARRRSDRSAAAAWRRRSRAELALWRVDGFEGPALLRACASRPIERWEGPLALAHAALALEASDAGRLCLACAEIVSGEGARAARRLTELLARDVAPAVGRAALCALALADRSALESERRARSAEHADPRDPTAT